MFILKTQEQLTKAVNKAKTVKPRLRVLAFGQYLVAGSKGDAYTVTCTRDERGQKVVDCQCKGAERGLVCYHAAAAVGVHVAIAADTNHPYRHAAACLA